MKSVFQFGLKLALIAIFAFAQSNTAFAQKTFKWSQYNMKMTLPEDFKITKNTNSEFYAEGDGMELYMYVYEDQHVTADHMKDATEAFAKEMGFKYGSNWEDIEDDKFDGLYVEGTDKDGNKALICGLINRSNAANFWVVITFTDGDHNAKKDGIAILNSIE
jgi:hypothetical protein